MAQGTRSQALAERRNIRWRLPERVALVAASLGCVTSAHATSQCPTEFGSKDPLIDLLGWAVIVSGVVLGGWLCVYVIRRSRGLRRWRRAAIVLAGVVAMLLLWSGGLALAIASFFLRC